MRTKGVCLGCGRPSCTLFCDGCAPPSRSAMDTMHLEGADYSGGVRHNGYPMNIRGEGQFVVRNSPEYRDAN